MSYERAVLTYAVQSNISQSFLKRLALIRYAFVDDLPFVQLVVNVHYRDSPVRFHQEVYRSASSIDPVLADYMQTTIVK